MKVVGVSYRPTFDGYRGAFVDIIYHIQQPGINITTLKLYSMYTVGLFICEGRMHNLVKVAYIIYTVW